ncbi:MAG: DNA gyrase inhibitor YacG, partial [Alphaproteobacteria bacterium]
RKGRCPVCGKPLTEAFKPFCSKRCSDVDLNRWLAGVYRIETKEAPEEAELPPPAPTDDEG